MRLRVLTTVLLVVWIVASIMFLTGCDIDVNSNDSENKIYSTYTLPYTHENEVTHLSGITGRVVKCNFNSCLITWMNAYNKSINQQYWTCEYILGCKSLIKELSSEHTRNIVN